jgi:hypothetical protein
MGMRVWVGLVVATVVAVDVPSVRGDDGQQSLTLDGRLLFPASLEWLQSGPPNKARDGVVRMGC